MSGWRTHAGHAVALDIENIDTDQLIPARFMSTPRRAGYGPFLLHDLRHDAQGQAQPNFPLNRHPGASVLLTRRNFGSGSSREAAVYALLDFGIRVVIAPSFGDIFAANAVNNGLLPARIPSDRADTLIGELGDRCVAAGADLSARKLTLSQHTLPFEIDPVWAEKLMMGWDDIDLTRAHTAEIAAFQQKRRQHLAWAFPQGARPQDTDTQATSQGTGVGDRRFNP